MEKIYAWIDKFIVNLPAANDFERGFFLALLFVLLVALRLGKKGDGHQQAGRYADHSFHVNRLVRKSRPGRRM